MSIKQCFGLIIVLGLGLGGVSCSSNNKGKIEGTKWKSETATLFGKHIKAPGDNSPVGQRLEFNADGTMIHYIFTGVVPVKGRYTLGPGDSVRITFDGPKSETERAQVKIVGTKLFLTVSDGTETIYTKE